MTADENTTKMRAAHSFRDAYAKEQAAPREPLAAVGADEAGFCKGWLDMATISFDGKFNDGRLVAAVRERPNGRGTSIGLLTG
jgi:hypothetical protein